MQLKLHPNDICILSTERETIIDLDFRIRNERNEKTEIMCESKEIFESLEGMEYKLKKIRRNKKYNFWMNPGTMKLSTIHSFKGWETHTLFLIIEEYPENGEHSIWNLNELVYTGITRCRLNLIVINVGNTKYNEFFKQIVQKRIVQKW